jgi:Fe-S-cluster containining protein
VPFICLQCGNCCRLAGYVYIEEEEIAPIAKVLGHTPARFRKECLAEEEPGVWRIDDSFDEPCRFLQDGRCAIHNAKPSQCRSFPTSWRRKDVGDFCAAYREADKQETARKKCRKKKAAQAVR